MKHSAICRKMADALLYASFICLISCNKTVHGTKEELPLIYPPQNSIQLNISTGRNHDIFGDSIRPLVFFGDTLKTGVSVPVKGRIIYANSLQKPLVVPAGIPTRTIAYSNTHFLPAILKEKRIDESKLKKVTSDQDTSSFVLTNSTGDTIPTGIPIEISGVHLKCIQPKPISAVLPRMRENALYNIQYLDIEEGMVNSNITSVLEDRRGNLWFGSYIGGASRYDGTSFMHYTVRNGLTNDYVTFILEDKIGNLWFATHGGGVSKYDGSSFTSFTEKEGLPSNFINSILEDQHGNIWFASRDKGVSCYKPSTENQPGTFIHYSIKEGLLAGSINAMLEDHFGNIWLGSAQMGAIRYELPRNEHPGIFTYFTVNEGLPGNNIISLLEDKKGRIWLGGNEGIGCYDGITMIQYTEKEGLSSNRIRSLFEDKNGILWIGTSGGGANRFDGKSFTTFNEQNGLSNNIVKSICEDKSGNIWFATNGGGVCRYREKSFVHFATSQVATQYKTLAIHEDRNGKLWFGTMGDGVICYEPPTDIDGGTFKHFTIKEGLPVNNIQCIEEDKNGNLWFGTNSGGALKFDGKKFTFYTSQNGLSDNDIRCILADEGGNIWFGSLNRGITCLKQSINGQDGMFIQYSAKEGLPCNTIRDINEDSNGNLWIGTFGCGAIKFEVLQDSQSGHFTFYTNREGISANIVNAILEDKNKDLWFGTGRGIIRFRPAKDNPGGQLIYFGEKRGLSSPYVRSLLEDDIGNIWASTPKGLSIIPADTGNHTPAYMIPFYKSSGLKGIEFEFNSACIDSKDQLWWGGDKGIEMLDVNKFQVSSEIPHPVLRNIEINGEFVDFRNIPDSIKGNIKFSKVSLFENYPLGLELPYLKDHLMFHFSAIDWAAPSAIKYSYILEGLENAWSNPSSEPSAEYRNLPSGKFTFKVSAFGQSAQWSDPVEYTFIIHPPWWYAWWAYLIYMLVVISLVYLIYRFQLNRKLEIVENKRLLELDHLKNKLFANITHEFRTPLTLIHGPLSNALSSQASIEEKDLRSMYQQSQRLQQLITQMLDLQKVEAGRLKPQYVYGEVSAFIRYLFDAFASLAREKGVTLEFSSMPNEIKMDYDEEKLTQIITNLVSNAVRHTPEKGKVLMSLNVQSGDKLWIQIKDTGIGISPDELPFIFDRYYQSSRAAKGGTGIGLALAKNLVELLKGTIVVESKPNEGTVFKISFPITSFSSQKADPTFRKTKVAFEAYDDEIRFSPPDHLISDKPIVLIVEDHREVSLFVASCLAKDFSTMLAMDGDEGIKKAFEHIPDLIISDVMMPGKDGFELCATLKKDIRTSHIPIILLTGRGDQPALMEGIEHGADAYVIKPFEPAELILRVKKLLELRANLSQHYRQPAGTDQHETGTKASAKENEFLYKLRTFIEEQINNPQFNMNMLSKQMAMSHPQLHRKITALTGESTGKLVRSVRLAKAIELLKNSDLTISEIAYETGFSEPGYFTKVFSKEYNISPSEFRANPS